MKEFEFDARMEEPRYTRYARYAKDAYTSETGISIYPDGSMRLCLATVYFDGRVEGADQSAFLQGQWTGHVYLGQEDVDLAAFGPIEGGDWNKIATVILGHRWHGPANFLGFVADGHRFTSLPQDLVLRLTDYVKESIANPYEFAKQALAIYSRDTYRGGKA